MRRLDERRKAREAKEHRPRREDAERQRGEQRLQADDAVADSAAETVQDCDPMLVRRFAGVPAGTVRDQYTR